MSEEPQEATQEATQEPKDGFLLEVVGGRDAEVEKRTFVSHAAIARLRRGTDGGVQRVIRAGRESGILVTFATDIDTEPETEPRRGLVQEVFIPDNLELPAPAQPCNPQPEGAE